MWTALQILKCCRENCLIYTQKPKWTLWISHTVKPNYTWVTIEDIQNYYLQHFRLVGEITLTKGSAFTGSCLVWMLIFNLIKIFTRNEIKKKQVSTWRDSTDTEYSISLLQKGRNAAQFASESWLLPKCTSYTWEIAFRNSICPVIPETKIKISIIPVIPKGMEYCTQVRSFS